jgi:hypothetical protein
MLAAESESTSLRVKVTETFHAFKTDSQEKLYKIQTHWLHTDLCSGY